MTDVLAPKAVYLATVTSDAQAVEAIRRHLDGLAFEAGFASQQVTWHPDSCSSAGETGRRLPVRAYRALCQQPSRWVRAAKCKRKS